MTHTKIPIVPDMNELQNNMIQSINHFSQLCRIKVKDNDFIQKKVDQISEQRVEFRKFAEESIIHNLKMTTHADDLIVFAECCDDDDINNDDLLELLGPLLSDSKLYRAKAKLLKNQIKRILISLNEIVKGIAEYDEKITEKRGKLPNQIEKADKVTDGALSYLKGGFAAAGIGTVVAVIASPFTGGASLVAEAALGLGGLAIIGGTATATTSTAVAGGSLIASGILNYQLKGVREQFSQYLREMQNGLCNISVIISHCEFHWEKQIEEIEDIIKKLERNEQRIIKPLTRGILAKAKRTLASSESFSFNMRQALNRDAMQA